MRVATVQHAGEEHIRVAYQGDEEEQETYVRPQHLLDPEEKTTTGERVLEAAGIERGALRDEA